MNPEHPLILASLRRNRRQYLIATAVTIPTALFMIAAPAWSSEGRNITIACVVIGAIFLATGAGLVWITARHWRPERAPLMNALREQPGDIAWIYEERLDSQAAGFTVARNYSVKIGLVSGKSFTLSVKGSDREEVLRALGEIAPRATFGYSRELARQFKRDPRSLLANSGLERAS